jgi:hypothetical protein
MKTLLFRCILAVTCGLLASCGWVEAPWIPGSSAAAAKNQIMLIRQQPPSFGYRRLQAQGTEFRDLGVFVKQRGLPNFLAETGAGERRYFILYYLKNRQAFACRTRLDRGQAVEFAGPYPITDREFKLLNGFRNQARPH